MSKLGLKIVFLTNVIIASGFLFIPSASLAKTCPKTEGIKLRGGELVIPFGKSATITSPYIKISALGNNKICAKGKAINISLNPTASSASYNIQLFGKGNRRLESSRNFNSLVYKSGGSSVIDLGGDIDSALIRTASENDSIRARSIFRNVSVNLGTGDDYINWSNKDSQSPSKMTVLSLAGNNRLFLPSSTNLKMETGPGSDIVGVTGDTGEAFSRKVITGFGSDNVSINARGKTVAYLSAKKGYRKNYQDKDYYLGSNGFDKVLDYYGDGNIIYGGKSSDELFSLNKASSTIYGEIGNDKLYSAAQGKYMDKLNGGRNNDFIYANRGQKNRPTQGAIIEGGEGDESIIRGSQGDDVIIYRSGVKKILAGPGDDYILRTSIGRGVIDGESGEDSLSYMLHSYNSEKEDDACLQAVMPDPKKGMTGIHVAMKDVNGILFGESWRHLSFTRKENGQRICIKANLDKLLSFEKIVGSPEDDYISSDRGMIQGIFGSDLMSLSGEGGMVDNLGSAPNKKDSVCVQGGSTVPCYSPSGSAAQARYFLEDKVIVSFIDNWMIMIGSNGPENIRFIKNKNTDYQVHSSREMIVTENGRCRKIDAYKLSCSSLPISIGASLGAGNDSVVVEPTFPKSISMTMNLGSGSNNAYGGPGDDFISSSFGETNSWGRGGDDRIILIGDGSANGGPGDDLLNPRQSPCNGAALYGGAGSDNALFVGSGPVFVDYGLRGTPKGIRSLDPGWGSVSPFTSGALSFDVVADDCPEGKSPLYIFPDIEAIEGTSDTDYFIGSQTRPLKILGRQGPDIYWTEGNGIVDKMTIHGQKDGSHDLLRVDMGDQVMACFGDAGHIPIDNDQPPPGCPIGLRLP